MSPTGTKTIAMLQSLEPKSTHTLSDSLVEFLPKIQQIPSCRLKFRTRIFFLIMLIGMTTQSKCMPSSLWLISPQNQPFMSLLLKQVELSMHMDPSTPPLLTPSTISQSAHKQSKYPSTKFPSSPISPSTKSPSLTELPGSIKRKSSTCF